jgi:hypothetical protein
MGFLDFFGGLTPEQVGRRNRTLYKQNKKTLDDLQKTFNELVKKGDLDKGDEENLLPSYMLSRFQDIDTHLAKISWHEKDIVAKNKEIEKINKRNEPPVIEAHDLNEKNKLKQEIIALEKDVLSYVGEIKGEITSLLTNFGRLIVLTKQIREQVMDEKTKKLLEDYGEHVESAKSVITREFTFETRVEKEAQKEIKRINKVGHL